MTTQRRSRGNLSRVNPSSRRCMQKFALVMWVTVVALMLATLATEGFEVWTFVVIACAAGAALVTSWDLRRQRRMSD